MYPQVIIQLGCIILSKVSNKTFSSEYIVGIIRKNVHERISIMS